jgi:hypothetical protein
VKKKKKKMFTQNDLDFALAKRQRERAAKSVAKRMTWTPEQRAAQARKAALSRKDRAEPTPWYGVVLYPEDYEWKGVAHALKVLDEMHNSPPVFWSQDEKEALKAQREWSLKKHRMSEIIEKYYDPAGKLKVEFSHEPDPERQLQALREVLREAR